MGSVAIGNPGVASLLQTLKSAGTPAFNSVLDSPTVESALQKAPASDLVQLSDQALQLQTVQGLFGNSSASETAAPQIPTQNLNVNSILQSLDSSLGTPAASSPNANSQAPSVDSASSIASQLSTFQADLQAQQVQALFGTAPAAASADNSLNVFA